mgnify:CR=1 FL=1
MRAACVDRDHSQSSQHVQLRVQFVNVTTKLANVR